MISPAAMAIAMITVMLWIVWSDTIRARRPSQILYTVRIALFLVVAGVMVVNMVRYPHLYPGTTRAITIVAVLVGLGGPGRGARRRVKRR